MPENLAVPAITALGYAGILAGPAAIGFVAHFLESLDRVPDADRIIARCRREQPIVAGITPIEGPPIDRSQPRSKLAASQSRANGRLGNVVPRLPRLGRVLDG